MSNAAFRRIVSISSVMALGLWITGAGVAGAQTDTVSDAPAELTEAIAQIDDAANRQNLNQVLRYYSPQFTSPDGLTVESLKTGLQSLWERFPELTYTTELIEWQQEGTALIAETTTTIHGTDDESGRNMRLHATITSRQRFEGGQIVQQEILSEQSQLSSGVNPPSVTVILPDDVTSGQEFAFDAIVREPLGNRYLLGTAIEEAVSADAYVSPAPIDLELLSAGGLFKTAAAPEQPGDRWISAALVREDGITIITRRLQVTGTTTSSNR